MTRRLISTGSPFEADYAYSRAVVQGDWCFVAGTTGYDYTTMSMPEDVGEQARNALATIGNALREAGFGMGDVVRTVVYLTDAADHPAIGQALRDVFGHVRPANTTVVSALLRPEMKIEIEATALRHPGPQRP
ncbi:MAG: RidA family protein [Rhizobiaceae bacterium]|nr:RidA family protein [Rhizobiaceae bacterium]MCV0407288.1 RidA family protein [Rhizobiaceae bacterium]